MGQFGSKGPKIGPQDRAILELKLQRDRIQQYQRKVRIGPPPFCLTPAHIRGARKI